MAGRLTQLHEAGADGIVCLPAARDPLAQYERLALVRERLRVCQPGDDDRSNDRPG